MFGAASSAPALSHEVRLRAITPVATLPIDASPPRIPARLETPANLPRTELFAVRDCNHARSRTLLVATDRPVMMRTEVRSMVTNERAGLESVLRLAREIAAKLEPMAASASSTDGLCLRLAQAHALGLIDQLAEIVGEQDAEVARVTMIHATSRNTRTLEEETLQAL
jgi:hypothetical protein